MVKTNVNDPKSLDAAIYKILSLNFHSLEEDLANGDIKLEIEVERNTGHFAAVYRALIDEAPVMVRVKENGSFDLIDSYARDEVVNGVKTKYSMAMSDYYYDIDKYIETGEKDPLDIPIMRDDNEFPNALMRGDAIIIESDTLNSNGKPLKGKPQADKPQASKAKPEKSAEPEYLPDNSKKFYALASGHNPDMKGLKDNVEPALNKLMKKYYDKTGDTAEITSAYRGAERQAAAIKSNMDDKGASWVDIYRNKEVAGKMKQAYLDNKGNSAKQLSEITKVIQSAIDDGIYISQHMSGEKVDVRTRGLDDVRLFKKLAREEGWVVLDEGNHIDIHYTKAADYAPTMLAKSADKAAEKPSDKPSAKPAEKNTASSIDKEELTRLAELTLGKSGLDIDNNGNIYPKGDFNQAIGSFINNYSKIYTKTDGVAKTIEVATNADYKPSIPVINNAPEKPVPPAPAPAIDEKAAEEKSKADSQLDKSIKSILGKHDDSSSEKSQAAEIALSTQNEKMAEAVNNLRSNSVDYIETGDSANFASSARRNSAQTQESSKGITG